MENQDLLFFYGLDCPHCIDAEKIIDDLIEEGFEIKKLEVWYNEENNNLLEKLDSEDDNCGGIPFFLNQKTNKIICGNAPYKEIKAWAEGK